MRIQLSNQAREFNVRYNESFNVIEGNAGFAVRLGDKLVGFSGEDVSTVSLQVRQGQLHITLKAEDGSNLSEYQIPSTSVLQNKMNDLIEANVSFNPRESEELANLLRLSMTGSVSRSEVLLLLDEISHATPRVEQGQAIDAGDIYPDLSRQVKKLLSVMPDEIQRFILLNNMDRFGPELWKTLHFLTKVDLELHPTTARWLAGKADFNYVVQAELNEIAANTPLQNVKGIQNIDPKAFLDLMKRLESIKVAGDFRTLTFPPAVARFALKEFPVTIPDFTAADSFEELEAAFMVRQKTTHPRPGTTDDPLAERLFQSLNTKKYKELADFLVGKPGAKFTVEARESLLHFLKNLPQGTAGNLASINPGAYERVLRFLQTQEIDLAELLQGVATKLPSNPKMNPAFLKELGRDFASLSGTEKLAFYVLDHLDPVAHEKLFNYFEGKQKLSRMPSTLARELGQFLEQKQFPEVKNGLKQLSLERFRELAKILQSHSDLSAPKDYLPANDSLRKVLFDLTGKLQERPDPQTNLARPPGRENPNLAEALARATPANRNHMLSEHLLAKLNQFRRVALLDQVWQAEKLADRMLHGTQDLYQGSRDLVDNLSRLMDLLSDRDTPVEWDLWKQPKSPPGEDPRPGLREKLLQSDKGHARYVEMDKLLPPREHDLASKVEEVGWVRRLERMANLVENNRNNNHAKLLNVLRKHRQLLKDLATSLQGSPEHDWSFSQKSPLRKRKLEQFQEFRKQLLEGRSMKTDDLFDGPFLRSEFGENAERIQQMEMRRFAPLFKEMIERFSSEPKDLLDQLMRMLQLPKDSSGLEAGAKLQGLIENLRDFNQHQNLNQLPLYLSLPLNFGGQQSQFELAYFKLPNPDKDRNRFLVVIHLDFTGLGHLRVDALRDNDQFSATFWVENTRMHHLLMRELHQLEDSLEEGGLGDVSLNIKLEPGRAASSVAQLCVSSHEGELDVEI